MRSLLKLSVLDLLWLALLIASLTAWGIQRQRAMERAEKLQPSLLRRPGFALPSTASLQRRDALHKYASLTNQQLDQEFAALAANDQGSHHAGYDTCLTEMARRCMVDELQRHYDTLMAQKDASHWYPYNLELLTALRRAQGKPDPLKIEVFLADPPRLGTDNPAPIVQASITNVDAGGESVHFTRGGDDRGGRRERWRVLLINEQGRPARDSNFTPFIGGGLVTGGPFAYGQVDRDRHVFDLRRYVAPSRSGKYQLQLLYHNELSLANEPDVSGLIVTKSEPINVIIHVPERLSDPPSGMQTFLAIVAAAGFLAGASAIGNRRRSSKSLIFRRDLVWIILLAAIALGVWLDDLYCDRKLADLEPDADARWTIRLDADPRAAATAESRF